MHRIKARGAQGPWPVVSVGADSEQLHSMNWHDFQPNHPTPAAISQWEEMLSPREGSTKLGEWAKDCDEVWQNDWYHWYKNKPQCPDLLWAVVYSISSATHTHKHEFYGTWSIALYFLTGLNLFQCSMWPFLNKPPVAAVQTWVTASRHYWAWKAKIMFLTFWFYLCFVNLFQVCKLSAINTHHCSWHFCAAIPLIIWLSKAHESSTPCCCQRRFYFAGCHQHPPLLLLIKAAQSTSLTSNWRSRLLITAMLFSSLSWAYLMARL